MRADGEIQLLQSGQYCNESLLSAVFGGGMEMQGVHVCDISVVV